MKYKIVGDSCCDFTAEDLKKEYISRVPLILTVGDTDVIDDDTFDQEKYLDMVDRCPECPRSSCPSPENYMQHFEGAENVFVVTLSSKLSGSYNSAMLAKQIYQENHPDVKIHVFDSKSAAAAQHLICERLERYIEQDLDFKTIVEKTEEYVGEIRTLFVLDNLDTMRKNGRITKVKALAANMLNIKPVLHGVDGEIQQLDQARGMNKALNKLLSHIEKRRMKITVAGVQKEVADGLTVAQLIVDEKVETPQYVTVTINDEFVENGTFESTVLKDGDTVEFLYFMGGGQ